MRRLALAIAASVIAAACSSSTPAGPGPIAAGSTMATEAKGSDGPRAWIAHLNGGGEVPARDTVAQGQVKFDLNEDGDAISWKLMATNIDNVIAAHIHVGSATINGPVVQFLYGNAPAGGGRQTGILSSGEFRAATLTGPLAGHPLSDLLAQMNAGNTYVNVHTNDGVSPTNTGAGDFPGGEIRGQLQIIGPQD